MNRKKRREYAWLRRNGAGKAQKINQLKIDNSKESAYCL